MIYLGQDDRGNGGRSHFSQSMRVATLGSGSEGNAHLFECDGTSILIDAGFGIRETKKRLQKLGRRFEDLDAILLTHEHGDHIRGAASISRKYEIPVYGTRGSLEGSFLTADDIPSRFITNGRAFRVGELQIHPAATSHDAFDPSCFVVESRAGVRAGLATDLGYATREVRAHLGSCDILLWESNYDTDMLRTGPYPWFLKRRILSRVGHLSNEESCQALYDLVGPNLKHLVLIHLSRTNNLASIARAEAKRVISEIGADVTLHVSAQREPTGIIDGSVRSSSTPERRSRPRVQMQLFPI